MSFIVGVVGALRGDPNCFGKTLNVEDIASAFWEYVNGPGPDHITLKGTVHNLSVSVSFEIVLLLLLLNVFFLLLQVFVRKHSGGVVYVGPSFIYQPGDLIEHSRAFVEMATYFGGLAR